MIQSFRYCYVQNVCLRLKFVDFYFKEDMTILKGLSHNV